MLLPSFTLFFLMLTACNSLDTLVVNQKISDGETIISGNELFELGFFSPGSSNNRYLGIWYKNTSPVTIAWVANPINPVNNTLGVVNFDRQGTLSIVNGGGTIIWSSNSSVSSTSANSVAQLQDDGNLVIKDENSVLWQSFDYPGDTYLPGMKVGKNPITGRETSLRSWKSADDPSPGEYTVSMLLAEGKYQQEYISRRSVIQARLGPYNGIQFAGQPNYKPNQFYSYKIDFVVNQKEMYYMFSFNSTAYAFRCIITPGGRHEFWHMNIRNKEWTQDLTLPLDNCDTYRLCGPYGSCNTVAYPKCGCLKGFDSYNPDPSSPDNYTSGCRRSTALDCGYGEGFLRLLSMKLPDTQNAVFSGNMSVQDCEVACKNNCSCTAYANPNVTPGGVGCLLWFGELHDVRVYPQNGQDLYVRLAASELQDLKSKIHKKKQVVITVTSSISAGLILLALALYTWSKWKNTSKAERAGRPAMILDKDNICSREKGDIEVPLFSLSEISKATNEFSVFNKLGEGGFGPVYKGVLKEGQEIAVKRLSKSSRQGLDEFENEVICIAKLQHRNLVKLLGYCMQGDETMLVYEYMPNKSLDSFIFDESSQSSLDWPLRFHIIHGIARGLLYLHQDSRHRIVHRDLKAGNILLDHDMNPKISDFGLARMFSEHESEANTKRVVGTLGYISPEYAVNGIFSVKSDIFSFGVLVLEIVSGKKNRGFVADDHHDNLLGHVWRLYKEGKSLEIIDPTLVESCSISEVLRSIHIALLCVQQLAEDRPNTPSVVSMLGGEGSLPSPKQPGFFIQGTGNGSTSTVPLSPSINGVSLTLIEGR